VRVPTPKRVGRGFRLHGQEVGLEGRDVLAALKAAANGKLKGYLDVCMEPLVSVDFLGNPHSSIVDGQSFSRRRNARQGPLVV
jgi:glyceraldehyde 3-phosphate dehydrogenase